MTRIGRLGAFALAIWACAFGEARSTGAVSLLDAQQLGPAISRSGYCCVVDARAPARQVKDAIAEAVLYRKGVRIKPSAAVVVVADSDAEALSVGEEIRKSSGATEVFAVKGGAATWRTYLGVAAGAPPASFTFIIPRNTCESGRAIQELKSGRP